MSDCVQSLIGKGTTGAQHEQRPPSHDHHLLFEQESQVQEKHQVAHQICLGKCNPLQNDVSKQ